jgi:phosphate transport system substrate-binding protein
MKALAALAVGFASGVIACGLFSKLKSELHPHQLVGKGSTFVYPLMIHWSSVYWKGDEGGRIDYLPRGSSSGIKAVLDKTVDFACTDAPLSDEQLARAKTSGGEIIHVPLVLGAVVPIYNLPEVSQALRFSGPVLANIYLGKITKWNDKALQELNPKVAQELPDQPIRVVHRKDGSGTTYIWVDYLAKVSAESKQRLGVSTEVPWPVGAAESGNEGVAEYVKRTPASIGYVELAYAFRREIPFGLVQNREKEFVKASFESVGMAATNGLTSVPDDLRFSLTDPPGQGSYPICGATWAVVQRNQTAEKKKQLADFLYWALDKGQDEADALFYHRLPAALRERAEKQLGKLL